MKSPITKLLANPAMILRVGGGICFIAHGLLALAGKAGFVTLLGSFGLDAAQAATALKFIGILDVIVGLLILFKPNKWVLRWAMAWTALTIVAWGIHGDSWMDLGRRIPYVTTPMALLFLLYKRERAGEEGLSTPTVDETEASTIAMNVLTAEKEAAINKLDLSMICMKLMDTYDGPGWSRRQCAEVAHEYRRYLTLKLLYPDEPVVPNLAIDMMWHYHILDTQAYQKDCEAIFGYFLHHYPYFGMKGKADEKQFMSAFDRTKMLYAQTFGEPMEGAEYLPSFQVSRSA